MTPRIALLVLAVLAVILMAFTLTPEKRLLAAQRNFLEAVSRHRAEDVLALLHEDYTDSWGFRKEDWPLMLKDLQALSPDLELSAPEPLADAETGLVEARLQARAMASPAGQMIAAELQKHPVPARFLWKRTSWLPWSWELVEIQHPEVKVPSNYKPGDYAGGVEF